MNAPIISNYPQPLKSSTNLKNLKFPGATILSYRWFYVLLVIKNRNIYNRVNFKQSISDSFRAKEAKIAPAIV